jgi:hypothetical protein
MNPQESLINELKLAHIGFNNDRKCECGTLTNFAEECTLNNLVWGRLPRFAKRLISWDNRCWDCRNLTYRSPEYQRRPTDRFKLVEPIIGREFLSLRRLYKNTWVHPTIEYDSDSESESDESDESDSESSYDSDDTDSECDDGLNALEICGEMGNQIFEIKEKLTDGEFKNLMDNLSDLRKSKTREKIMPDPELVEQIEVQKGVIVELRAEMEKRMSVVQGSMLLKQSFSRIMDSSKSSNKKIKMLTDLMNADEKKIKSNPLLSDIF